MRTQYIKFISFLFLLFFSCKAISSPWEFEIAPYLWATNMNGRVSVGETTTHVNESFSDLLQQLDMGGMIYATAHKDNFGIYFNAMYAALSDSEEVQNINVNGENKFGILGEGISYIVLRKELGRESKLNVEPYVGFRHTFNNTSISLDSLTFTKNVRWTDPVLGVELLYDFNKRWATQLAADIGGTNTSTHYSYSTSATVSYQPAFWSHLKAYLGYRLLDQHYQTGSGDNFYDWDMKIFGPILGVGFTF